MKACDVTTKFYPTSSEPAALLLRGSGAPAKADRLSGSLGNPVEFVHRPAAQAQAQAQAEQQDRREAVRKSRSERFALLGVARRLLMNAGRAAGLEHPSDYHRTADCHHARLGPGVAIKRTTEHGGAFYAGVATCGNVWSCPVCAAKVQERRREEIAAGIRWAYSSNLQPVMVTLTFPHRAWHKLSDLLAQQDEALKRLRRGRPWSRFIESVGYRGLIRSLEVTHGKTAGIPTRMNSGSSVLMLTPRPSAPRSPSNGRAPAPAPACWTWTTPPRSRLSALTPWT